MRPWETADADFLFDLESRWNSVQYLEPHSKPMVERIETLESIQRRRAIDDPIHGIWIVVNRETGRPLGNLLLKPVPLSDGIAGDALVEIGWLLHPDAQGAGYATEAASAVMSDAKRNALSLVIAVTDPRNAASQRVCSRLGMDPRGVTRDFYDEANLLFGKSLRRIHPSGVSSSLFTISAPPLAVPVVRIPATAPPPELEA